MYAPSSYTTPLFIQCMCQCVVYYKSVLGIPGCYTFHRVIVSINVLCTLSQCDVYPRYTYYATKSISVSLSQCNVYARYAYLTFFLGSLYLSMACTLSQYAVYPRYTYYPFPRPNIYLPVYYMIKYSESVYIPQILILFHTLELMYVSTWSVM